MQNVRNRWPKAVAAIGVLSLISACAVVPMSGSPSPSTPTIAPKPPLPLVGATANTVRESLGKPSLIRQEPPAEVWQYAGRACILDVTLYADPAGALIARWIESRDLDGMPSDLTACLKAMGARNSSS